MYAGGFTGTILRIDLTKKEATTEPLPPEVARDYVGGAGFGIKYLYDEVPARHRPPGPRQQAHLRLGPLHRHDHPLREPHGGDRQVPARPGRSAWRSPGATSRWSSSSPATTP